MTIQEDLENTISFLQEFIDQVNLGLSVQSLSEDDYEALVYDDRSVLNWRGKFSHYLHDDSFHLGFRLVAEFQIDGAMLGIYVSINGYLHIFLIESMVRNTHGHPLNGRLTTLVVVAATYFLSLREDGKGVYVVEPHEDLIEHYEKFGFEVVEGNAMYASFQSLQEVQERIMSEFLN
ncbi:hypothetical protein [Shewanella mangrovisoli]|uniref:hypothetical protein n=1 Tax=Shewanella mangrovisoli TaxID=2864211 RepID=UPI00370CE501